MTKNNIPIARRYLTPSNIFQENTGAEEATPIKGDPLSVTEKYANSRPAVPGKNYKIKRHKNIPKITLYNPNDRRVKNEKFRGIDVIDTGKTLNTLAGVMKLFRLEYGNNVNNQEFGTYIYMAEWVPGDGTTIDVTEHLAEEMSKIEGQDQLNQMNASRRNGGKKTKKRKVKKNKNKRKKRKTIRNKKK
tara:strand:+ start:3110 stop:3676 length:567 start_codon:yes stop_codon:yes gene_type:complete